MKYVLFIIILCASVYGVRLQEQSNYENKINDLKALAESIRVKQEELRGIVEKLNSEKLAAQQDLEQARESRDSFESQMLSLKNDLAVTRQQDTVAKSAADAARQQLSQAAKDLQSAQASQPAIRAVQPTPPQPSAQQVAAQNQAAEQASKINKQIAALQIQAANLRAQATQVQQDSQTKMARDASAGLVYHDASDLKQIQALNDMAADCDRQIAALQAQLVSN